MGKTALKLPLGSGRVSARSGAGAGPTIAGKRRGAPLLSGRRAVLKKCADANRAWSSKNVRWCKRELHQHGITSVEGAHDISTPAKPSSS
ncbi:hypothetical protein KCP69_12150 [Salmonella enterica subsp. enterica]|nr:hypothetical protein KCP69_12150 [Salmonella enterica subsp. enterica]